MRQKNRADEDPAGATILVEARFQNARKNGTLRLDVDCATGALTTFPTTHTPTVARSQTILGVTDTVGSSCRMPDTKAEAHVLATSLGLQLGTDEFSFATSGAIKGLFAYAEETFPGIQGVAFWGTGGTAQDRQAPVAWPRYRPGCQSATLSPTSGFPTPTPTTHTPTGAGATFSPTRSPTEFSCCNLVAAIANMETRYFGTFTKVTMILQGGRPVYRNADGVYLYFWGPYHHWQIGPSYTDGDTAKVTSVYSDAACPTLASEWVAYDFDDDTWSENGVAISCLTGSPTTTPTTHAPTTAGVTFSPTLTPTTVPLHCGGSLSMDVGAGGSLTGIFVVPATGLAKVTFSTCNTAPDTVLTVDGI